MSKENIGDSNNTKGPQIPQDDNYHNEIIIGHGGLNAGMVGSHNDGNEGMGDGELERMITTMIGYLGIQCVDGIGPEELDEDVDLKDPKDLCDQWLLSS